MANQRNNNNMLDNFDEEEVIGRIIRKEDISPSSQKATTAVEAVDQQQSPSSKPKGHIDYSDYTGYSRAFTKFEHPFPCFPGEKRMMLTTPAHEGILFQRPMKVGSTSITGIVLRLVHNRGQKEYGYDKCKHRCMHGTGKQLDFYHRDKTKSFLFSIVREPQARAISQIFHFEVTAGQHEPTDEFLQTRLLQNFNHLHYYDDLGTRNYTKPGDEGRLRMALAKKAGFKTMLEYTKSLPTKAAQRAHERISKQYRKYGNTSMDTVLQHILEDYDFIAIMERMDESLVVLQMLFNLTTKEILYTHARSGGSWSNGFKDRPCFIILPSFQSPGMKAFYASDEWKTHIARDVKFYKAVHKSMDRTIEGLGREEFDERLRVFRAALKVAATNCKTKIRTMCSEAGEVIKPVNTTCYFWGEGCDHDCIDELEL